MSQATRDSSKPFSPVRPDVSLPNLENEILKFWDEQKIFEKSLHSRANAKAYSFYDGPPFATGLPHYGHIMAGVLKDIVPRYWTMKGYSVPRRFGWDCHGLPVEYEINKAHKLDSRKQIIEELGIAKYNELCRSIVQRYSQEWKRTVRRVGRWVDMENAYFTMDVSFMQSVWWVFQQMFEKGLIYEGHKVVPYSVGLSTPLSNFEANLNYKQVQDPAVTITLPLTGQPGVSILAWTTTPWTLPSNLALAVHRDTDYVHVLIKDAGALKIAAEFNGQTFIVAQALVKSVFGKDADKHTEVTGTVKGSELLGLTYTPLLPFFKDLAKEGAFKIIHSDHVTTESGTGIVHMAPAYGEDDYYACKANGVPLVNPVDDDGMFTKEVARMDGTTLDLPGKRVKEADKEIILELKRLARLFKQDTLEHSYPFCWRTDTPLIYRAVSSWFVAVEKIRDQIVANNQTTQWVPDHLRDGRFGKWLENARDWAVSRNRFWGTPIPIWRNEEGDVICIGSREELERMSGEKVDDLHIEFVNPVFLKPELVEAEWKKKGINRTLKGRSPFKRVEAVLDCWFESGSMPYAQWGYPFGDAGAKAAGHVVANEKQLMEVFPADFIAEGLDQTRGWFYTLMVIGTALYGKAPFKNVVVNGLILAEDGKKMSKSLKNYPDPMEVLDKHGADALRLYLIDSPVVKAQELKFSEVGVRDVVRRILLRWWNSYSFFVSYGNIDDFRPRLAADGTLAGDARKSPNILDQWLISRLNSLIENTQREMTAYRLYNVVPQLLQFVEDLTNTYIRFNRSHFWADGMPEDKRLAYETLYETLTTLSRLMAPFAPFMAEATYQNLTGVLGKKSESVHLEDFPEANAELKRPELEEAVKVMEALVLLGRNYRETTKLKAKIPLKSMKIIHREKRVLENLKKFEPYFQDELNVRKIEYISNEDEYVQVTAKANFPVLGKRFGAKMKAVAAKIQAMPISDLLKLEAGGSFQAEGEEITISDVEIRRAPKPAHPGVVTHHLVSIWMDTEVSEEQKEEGLSREIMRKIQAARKAADLKLDDRIEILLFCSESARHVVERFRETILSETLGKKLDFESSQDSAKWDQYKGHTAETIDVLESAFELKVAVRAV